MTISKTAFERWALSHSYDIAPAEFPSEIRQYADGQTQAAFLAWTTILEPETFIERILSFTIRNPEPAEAQRFLVIRHTESEE
jgi:hypothetical protein